MVFVTMMTGAVRILAGMFLIFKNTCVSTKTFTDLRPYGMTY